MEVVISRSGGKIRVDYLCNDGRQVILFESISSGMLQTKFDESGSILDQVLLKPDGRSIEQVSNGFIAEIGATNIVDGKYSEIKLQRHCPKCGSMPLTRYLDTKRYPVDVPVMPFYICQGCKEKSYYMTDDYLKRLVKSNKSLFSEDELSQMAKDENAFINELRANIIRIFASKRIMYVK